MGQSYLIRYGLARSVARFEAGPDLGPFGRGRILVVRTHRGVEIGEVLAEAPASFEGAAESAPILREATPEDLERAREAEADRPAHFAACAVVFAEGTWPLELIDAEPLLERGRTVLHYLGAHRLDASGLVAALKARCGLDVVLEPAGLDIEEPEPEAEAEPEAHGCGSCGSSAAGGCGSGGCGSCGLLGRLRRMRRQGRRRRPQGRPRRALILPANPTSRGGGPIAARAPSRGRKFRLPRAKRRSETGSSR